MNPFSSTLALLIALPAPLFLRASDDGIPNPRIDYQGFVKGAVEVGKLREKRRLTEIEFLRMASGPGTIVLDARSDDKYEMLHIKGAKHLSLTNVTAGELEKVIPDKGTRILIYCNNNFLDEPVALAQKAARASLNIYTFNTLYAYGYRNIFELGPLIDIKKSRLPFEGTLAPAAK